MREKKKFILNQCINVILLVLVIIGTTLLNLVSKDSDLVGYFNDYEKKITDSYLIFFITGIIVALLLGISMAISFLKLENVNRIISIFTAGLLALPLAGIFVACCKNNSLQIFILVLLLIIYLGNIAYQLYLLISAGKEVDKKEDTYFKELQ